MTTKNTGRSQRPQLLSSKDSKLQCHPILKTAKKTLQNHNLDNNECQTISLTEPEYLFSEVLLGQISCSSMPRSLYSRKMRQASQQVQSKINFMIEEITQVQFRQIHMRTQQSGKCHRKTIKSSVDLNPFKFEAKYMENLDTSARTLLKYKSEGIGKYRRPYHTTKKMDTEMINKIVEGYQVFYAKQLTNKVVNLCVCKLCYGQDDAITNALVPYERKWMIAPDQLISKRRQAKILTFHFEKPQESKYMERRFEIYKNRGDSCLRGVSKHFIRARINQLPFDGKLRVRKVVERQNASQQSSG